MIIPIAIVGRLAEGDEHLLGYRAIVAGPESPWRGAWYGPRAKVYREGFHLLEGQGVALVVGGRARAEEMATEVAGCPYPVILVAFSGSPRGRAYRTLEAAVKARREAGQTVHLFQLTPTFGCWMEAGDGVCGFTGGYVEDSTPRRA